MPSVDCEEVIGLIRKGVQQIISLGLRDDSPEKIQDRLAFEFKPVVKDDPEALFRLEAQLNVLLRDIPKGEAQELRNKIERVLALVKVAISGCA